MRKNGRKANTYGQKTVPGVQLGRHRFAWRPDQVLLLRILTLPVLRSRLGHPKAESPRKASPRYPITALCTCVWPK